MVLDFIEILKVIFLGIVEGITEWLPISSTGHMILVDEFITLNMSEAFKEMFEAAKDDGMHIWVRSPYRSYQTQNILYESYASEDGYDKADTYSARPGYSEHQTGLAVDVVADDNSLANFENTKEFTWIKNNAYKYGFIMRYPKDKEYITGYMYESWHYRYVGKEIAKEIYDKGLTFEEYYAYYVEKGLN